MCEHLHIVKKSLKKHPPFFIKINYVFDIKEMFHPLPEVPMTTPDMNKLSYARALIKAGLARDLILKITLISNYQYTQIQREVLAA